MSVQTAIKDEFEGTQILSKAYTSEVRRLRDLGLSVDKASIARVIVTKWEKPSLGRYKLNADGCSKGK